MEHAKRRLFPFLVPTVWLLIASCASPPTSAVSREVARFTHTVEDPSRFEQNYAAENLFDLRDAILGDQRQGPRAVEAHNEELLRILDRIQPSPESRRGSWKPSLTAQEAQRLFRWLESHPVAGMRNIDSYDPKGSIGFCFGHATAVLLQALRK